MTARRVVAVVDDDPAQRYLLANALKRAGYDSELCQNGREALKQAEHCHLMILDIRLPDLSGLEVLQILRKSRPALPVVLLTAFIDLRDAVAAIKAGALDYLEKPIDLDQLFTLVEAAIGLPANGEPESTAFDLPPDTIVKSDAMRQVYEAANRVAKSRATVLILGESGTGKGILASFIHMNSLRAGCPFVRADCGAMPDDLIASELFGHERGAFTGAEEQRIGRVEEADGGTIFLDEIGELPVELQPKLLHVIETGVFRRVGGSRDLKANVRIIAATNADLATAIERGAFRKDLYYRLNVVSVEIPPLRNHQEDTLPFAEEFLHSRGKRLTPSAQRVLMNYAWPGNFRELRNVLEHASIAAHGSSILPSDFPQYLLQFKPVAPSGSVLVGNIREIERRAILEALEKTGGNKTRAAQLLGISRSNLSYKLRDYQM